MRACWHAEDGGAALSCAHVWHAPSMCASMRYGCVGGNMRALCVDMQSLNMRLAGGRMQRMWTAGAAIGTEPRV